MLNLFTKFCATSITRVLLAVLLTGIGLTVGAGAVAFGGDGQVQAVKRPDASVGNDFYVGNRPPLLPSPFMKLPIGAIKPRGWVRKQLELEADGFVGHLPELSGFLKEKDNAWLSPTGKGHGGWEAAPYWLKGYGDLGYVLGDQRIIKEARKWIEAVLAGQREDGWFGPRANLRSTRRRSPGKPDLWPNMPMLNVLQSYYEYSGDERVLRLMSDYFRWELNVPDEDFLPPFWQQQRAGDNLASVYWLYNRTGDAWLLELAEKLHRHAANWTQKVASWHGVNICQGFREPATYYMQSKNPKHLQDTERNYQTVMGRYGQVPGGMFGADEGCRRGYTGPRQAAETCSMVEMMLSHETLLKITGDPKWADRCEDVAFNSLPASMTSDLKALRYLTAPNLILADRHNKFPALRNHGCQLMFDPHRYRCCQHNVSHGWPYYAEHLWLATPTGGLAAVLYAPCEVTAKVGDGTKVTIAETTRYPFDETIELAVSLPKPISFPLYLRIPAWCDAPKVKINGRQVEIKAKSRGYIKISRSWSDGDIVNLELPMEVRLTRWAKNLNSVSVHCGPLAYSLKIGEKYVRAGGTDKWPAYEVHPTTPWNYGLVLNREDSASSFEVVRRSWPESGQPFETDAAPIELRAKAKKIPAWKKDYLGLVGPLNMSPVKSNEPTETVRLIPMGCARLRISAFPVIGDWDGAHTWVEPPIVMPTVPHAASHCWRGGSVIALSDGVIPYGSDDREMLRFTWWDRRGTTEWVSYIFSEPRTISQVEVYWYDDTGWDRMCRLPKSWRVEWLDNGTWRSVAGIDHYGVDRDRSNKVTFEPVTTKQIRLVVELQPKFSAGILEWRVK